VDGGRPKPMDLHALPKAMQMYHKIIKQGDSI